MAVYTVETFVWDGNTDRWLYDFELTLDTRTIMWFDWDNAGHSDRWGEMIEIRLGVNGYYRDYFIKYSDAKFLRSKG
jgi:hypothetical protein